MTAAHVVAIGATIATLTESDLIGERFNYETQPLPALGGRRARSEFIVLGHGVTASHEKNLSGAFAHEDWAVGYDESCMAEKYQLGHFEISWSASLKPMFGPNATGVARSANAQTIEGRRLFTAGYSAVTIPGVPPDAWPMYIDSNCKLKPPDSLRDDRDEFARFRHVVTDCELHPGGSGQPLLSVVTENGRVALDERGRPRIEALGLFQFGTRRAGPDSENHMMAFSYGALGDLRPFLTVKIAGELRDLLHKEAAERDVDWLIRTAVSRRIAERNWP